MVCKFVIMELPIIIMTAIIMLERRTRLRFFRMGADATRPRAFFKLCYENNFQYKENLKINCKIIFNHDLMPRKYSSNFSIIGN